MTVEQTLAELVGIDSVSSTSNSGVISCLTAHCEAVGLNVRHFPSSDERNVAKTSMVATCLASSQLESEGAKVSESTNIELALVGHTDTVPYDPAWTEALQLTEQDGKLHGLGACDTKGFIAAAITAIKKIDIKQLRKPLALIFTADEEVGLIGAKRLADIKPFRVQNAIVGEPTGLRTMRAGKGYCLAEINVRGHGAHSAHPNLGRSAIFGAARLIAQIERVAESLKSVESADFDPPYTTLNVGLVNGGTAKNVIADECRFTLEWRPIPGQRSDYVLSLVEESIKDLQKEDLGFLCDVNIVRIDDGFETSADSRVVRVLEALTGRKSGTIPFSSEARQMMALGAETVVLGPGDIRVAHRAGEFVPLDQLNDCVRLLRDAIEQFCM